MSGPADDCEGERVFIGLGGNIGDPRKAMGAAIRALAADPQIRIANVSSLYRTPPWGLVDQPDFLNAVAELRTERSPRELLETCLGIEADMKRRRSERWGPRVIDLDIIAFGDRHIDEANLTVPHPRLHERAFVLMPLAEIAPTLEIGGLRASDLLAAVDTDGIVIEEYGRNWCSD